MTTTIPDMPDTAMARLAPILDAYQASLTPSFAAEFERLKMEPSGINVVALVSNGSVVVHVTLLLADGPHTILHLDGARIGLREVGGEAMYDDTLE